MTEEIQVTGTEVAGLFNTNSEESLTNQERMILSALLKRDDRVDLAIPDDMDAMELWRTLDICSRVFVRVRHANGQLKLLIGRALLVIQNTPEVFKSRGFTSFDQFMSNTDKGLPSITGISRAELFKAKSVAASMGPETNLEDIRDIGSFTKIQLVAGYTEAGSDKQKEYVAFAKTSTIQQLREKIAADGNGVTEADLEYDLLQVSCTKAQKKFLQQFLTNPRVKAYCQKEDAGSILEMAAMECVGEWQVEELVVA